MAVSPILKPSKNRTEIIESVIVVATNTGLSVSIFLLCIHLIVFALVDDFGNLPGKNLASFCVALLLEYSSTLLSGVLNEGNGCYVNEIAAHYFIMSSAFWMLTMSYDVWATLRSSTQELIVSSGRQRKKFLLYSLWSWLMPAFLTLLVFFVLPQVFQNFDLGYQDFDRKTCKFIESDMVYVFVTTVFGTILLLNTFFFVCSVYYILSTQSAIKSTKNTAIITHFQLYGRLSLIMGVTWTAEFIIYYSDFDILCVTFKIINTFEGLFIVIAFTSRKEVLQYMKSLHVVRSLQNAPHFYHYMSVRRL